MNSVASVFEGNYRETVVSVLKSVAPCAQDNAAGFNSDGADAISVL